MKDILAGHGFTVVLRENGEEGVLAALEYDPDLIIMDVNMPVMDGFQASRMLKSYPQTRMIPVAVFTDDRDIEKKVRFFDVGVEDFIIKDADEAEVLARINSLLRWKRNRDRIVKDKNKLDNLLDNLSDSVIITDNAGKLVFYNQPAAERFNLIPELIMEKSLRDILPETEKIMRMFSTIENHEELDNLEVEIERDGTARIYEVDICRVSIGLYEDVGAAVILNDVTAEREAERLKAEFYSMIAHELRTPISVVLGYTQLILEGKTGEINKMQSEFLGGIEEKGRHLLKLVNDFLEVSRMECNCVKLERSDFDLSALVEKTVNGLKLLSNNKNIALTIDSGSDGLMANGDKDKLEQVFINLIENAIKYTEEGGKVSVSCGRDSGGVIVKISDTGIGMSDDELEYIFDRFKRLDNAEKKRIKGTGLGLAIVKEIIDAHGGEIGVTSIEGVGSTFDVRLPDEIPAPESLEKRSSGIEAATPTT